MKKSRRKFINQSLTIGTGIVFASCAENKGLEGVQKLSKRPIVISTWNNKGANNAAWEVLNNNGNAIDAVEAGARIPEGDPKDQSVGYGGRPDRNGEVTLDACIMDETGNCGAVTYLKNIMHPISVARKVMDETPHVMLTGEGALQFALDQGFEKQDLLTPNSKASYEEWLKESKYAPKVNIELHDTIGILAIDSKGDISGACTTSGLAYKMAGRVGDSPIIGAGLFVDNEVGGATATGMGELVMKSLGSFLVVELMRQGLSPGEACKEAVMRIVNKQDITDLQVGYIAIDKQGNFGGYSIKSGFVYVTTADGSTEEHEAEYYE